ncbi:MAG: hypothetical protein AB8F74_13150 [Saprospiraceae bacterium]
MKKKILLKLVLILLISSCSKDDTLSNDSILGCLSEFKETYTVSDCDTSIFQTDVCEYISLGGYKLEDSSKAYVVLACESLNNESKYVNEEGETITMVISKKSYKNNKVQYRSNQICDIDSTKVIGYCFNKEVIIIRLSSESPAIELNITLENFRDQESSNPEAIGDVLRILRRLDSNSYSVGLISILDQGSLDYEKFPGEEFYPSIEIAGVEYNDIFSFDSSIYPSPKFKYYYSKTLGLVGFIDLNNIAWRLE